MPVVTQLEPYRDDDGNEVICTANTEVKLKITFKGSHNKFVVHDGARLGWLVVDFDCDNGRFEIGRSKGVPPFSASVRIGQDSSVTIGDHVSVTSQVAISACEGASVTIGDDVMFAADNQVRADDGHPIFDVRTGKRVNVSRSVEIGSHVWLARGVVVLAGSRIGSGSVVGYSSVVKGRIPNNVIAAGIPARVIRRDTAWERPHLSLVRPFYKPDASTIKKSRYWRLTADDASAGPAWQQRARRAAGRAKRSVTRLRRAVGR